MISLTTITVTWELMREEIEWLPGVPDTIKSVSAIYYSYYRSRSFDALLIGQDELPLHDMLLPSGVETSCPVVDWFIDWLYQGFTAHQRQKGHTVPKQVHWAHWWWWYHQNIFMVLQSEHCGVKQYRPDWCSWSTTVVMRWQCGGGNAGGRQVHPGAIYGSGNVTPYRPLQR